jgi:RNA polymerase sporulation-specific sigma factor
MDCSCCDICDEDLIGAYHAGDNACLVSLVSRYLEVIDKKVYASGLEQNQADDAKQEALIAFLNAVKTYDAHHGALFRTYAGRCIDNSIKNFMIKMNTKKAKLLSQALSIDENPEEEWPDVSRHNPEQIYIDKERYHGLLDEIEVKLSDFEKNVLFLYLDGNNYSQISDLLGSSQKAVDNALQRVRKKLKTVLMK